MLQKLDISTGLMGHFSGLHVDFTFTIYKFSSSSSNGIYGTMNVDVSSTRDNAQEWFVLPTVWNMY